MDTTNIAPDDADGKRKAAFSRGLPELSRHRRCPVLLFWWLSRLGSGLRRARACRRLGSGRLGSGRLGRTRGWSGHSGLHVVSVDNSFSDVDGLIPPKHGALRPGLGGIDYHGETVVLRILHNHWSHLLQNAGRNLLLLVAGFFLEILDSAIQKFLLAFNLLLQGGERILVQLALLRGHLFLQAVEFIVLALQFVLLRLVFLAQGFQVAAALVAAENRFLDVDGPDFRARARASGSRRRRSSRAGRRGSRGGRGGGAAGLGQCGKRECNRYGQKNSQKITFHWIGCTPWNLGSGISLGNELQCRSSDRSRQSTLGRTEN